MHQAVANVETTNAANIVGREGDIQVWKRNRRIDLIGTGGLESDKIQQRCDPWRFRTAVEPAGLGDAVTNRSLTAMGKYVAVALPAPGD